MQPKTYIRLGQLFVYLFATVWGQVKDEDSEKRDAHAWYDEIDSVEQCFSAHRDVEGDIKVGFITASVIFNIPNGGNGQDVPFDRHVELGEIHANVDNVGACFFFLVSQIHLENYVEFWLY